MVSNSTQAATQQIFRIAQDMNLGVGDRLPSERKLSERLGWSRNTVREALIGMAAQGWVEIRTRRGAYLCVLPGKRLKEDVPQMAWSELLDAVRAMQFLAASLAGHACVRCGEESLARIERCTTGLGRALVENRLAGVWKALTAFYSELTALTENPLLIGFMEQIRSSALTEEASLPQLNTDELQAFFTAHVGFLEALRQQDAENAAIYALDSLDALMRFLLPEAARLQTREEG